MIETSRLLLRAWQERDLAPFAAMSTDPEVMRYLLRPETPEAVAPWIAGQVAHRAEHGFCFWAVEERGTGAFVGAVGLLRVSYEAHFTPAVELGWRIARPFWGQGYAPEAALASIQFGFHILNLGELVANACVGNVNSRRVMEKLGMTRDPADDFDHPHIAEPSSLRRQVLYRIAPTTLQRTSTAQLGHASA